MKVVTYYAIRTVSTNVRTKICDLCYQYCMHIQIEGGLMLLSTYNAPECEDKY